MDPAYYEVRPGSLDREALAALLASLMPLEHAANPERWPVAPSRSPISLADDYRTWRRHPAPYAAPAMEIQDLEPAAPLPLFVVYDPTRRIGQCGAGCYDAAGGPCGCICTGANHGAGRQQAICNTREHALAWLDRAAGAKTSVLAADILPGFVP